MSQEEINDYNIRCANFLSISNGYFKDEIDCPIPEYQWMCVFANCTYSMEKDDYPDRSVYNYLKFHSDWNWIHTIKNKICLLPEVIEFNLCYEDKKGYYVRICTEINKSMQILTQYKNKEEDAVVDAINSFLIKYNEQNK